MNILEVLKSYINFSYKDIIDIILVFILFYYILSTIWKTTAFPVLIGVVAISLITIISTYLNLQTFSFVLNKVTNILLIIIAIIFPSEVRRGLYLFGRLLPSLQKADVKEDVLDHIVNVVEAMGREKIGALIIFKNKDEMSDLIDSGQSLNSDVSEEIIYSIFQKNSPLHDGAIVIDKNKIVSAACYIPSISVDITIDKNMGTRHRAAVGFTRETDSIIVVTSEERGSISLAYSGVIETNLKKNELKMKIKEKLSGKKANEVE